MASWFSSPYYGLLYRHRNLQEAEQFVGAIVRFLPIAPTSQVLDVGCGEGRYALAFAKRGYPVEALDYEVEPRLLPEGTRFYKVDFRNWQPVQPYDLVGSFFSSFGHVKSWDGVLSSMRALRRFMRPGGYLVLDYLNVAQRNTTPEEVREIEGVRFFIRRWQDTHLLHKEIRVEDKGKESVYSETLYKLTQGDLATLAERVGLAVVAWWGDYAGNPFVVQQSPRLILLAQAPSPS